MAQGDILFFIDAHCLVHPNFFEDTCKVMREQCWSDVGSFHFPIGWDGGWYRPQFATHYQFTLEKDFWGEHVYGNFDRLTEIGAGGHGALAVKTDHFDRVQGYSAPFAEYGGDETYLDLKFARFGYRNYLFPDTYLMHCSQRRQNYPAGLYTVFRNNVISAYTIGGES